MRKEPRSAWGILESWQRKWYSKVVIHGLLYEIGQVVAVAVIV